jgi:hypothetical protein
VILNFYALSLEPDGIVNLALGLAPIIRGAILSHLFSDKLLKLAKRKSGISIKEFLCLSKDDSVRHLQGVEGSHLGEHEGG